MLSCHAKCAYKKEIIQEPCLEIRFTCANNISSAGKGTNEYLNDKIQYIQMNFIMRKVQRMILVI